MRAAEIAAPARPPIHINEADHERLSELVDALTDPGPGAALLAEELDRAVVVGPRYRGQPFVRLNSTVDYEDVATGQVRRLRVVLPADARIEEQSVSILSAAGAALIGLRAGQTMRWETADGRARTLRVLAVDEPAG